MAERPEDLNLPNAIVTRIIKDALPEGVNVGKDARLAMSKAASVFVLYATSCANSVAQQSKRKMMSGQDVLEAMSELEFDHLVEPLKKCLEAYKQEQKGKKEAAAEKRKKTQTDKDDKDGEEVVDLVVEEEEEAEMNEEEEDGEEEEDDDEEEES